MCGHCDSALPCKTKTINLFLITFTIISSKPDKKVSRDKRSYYGIYCRENSDDGGDDGAGYR